MVKDKRYQTVKLLIESGHITEFKQIFEHIPKSIVANDLGTNYTRLSKLIKHTEHIPLKDLITLSRFFGVDGRVMVDLAYKQILNKD
jgi:hypothetical protein